MLLVFECIFYYHEECIQVKELMGYIIEENLDIISITEMWINENLCGESL